ncbi:MAG: LysR family transcriptional activator of nhaA [Granulosicoccus sp.]|jgi:LysR family transcriptional activator of nhaA
MRHLNYTHLLYFWTVACEGSIVRASEVLNLTPQTISGQIKLLEETVGNSLFVRAGRGLVLTETGHIVKQYADEIFTLGAELSQRVKSKQALVTTTLNVGVVDSIPKLIALRVLEPVFELDEPIRMTCREGSMDQLLAELAIHRLDLVISDQGLPHGTGVKAYTHPLGESGVSLFAHKSIARKYSRNFPASLDNAPLLLPLQASVVRRGIDEWFENNGIQPRVIAEFSDSALLKAFGEAAHGLFPAPTAIATEVCSMYHSVCLGSIDTAKESFYAISPERKLKHPTVVKITEHSRQSLFK